MTLIVSEDGAADMLAAIVAQGPAEDLVLCLFANDVEPTRTTRYVEATFPGYRSERLSASAWKIVPGALHAEYPDVVFKCSDGTQSQDVYGYFLKRVTSGRVAWGERFAQGPFKISNTGDAITVSPSIDLG